MLTPEEKAWCRGLAAVRRKEYDAAAREFSLMGQQPAGNGRLSIIVEAVRVLACVQQEKKRLVEINDQIQETELHGKETVLRRQGIQEETRLNLPGLQQ